MKKIVTIGILALTLTVNLSPLNVQAAGVSQYYQCNGGNNAVTIRSSNCNLNDIQIKLQEFGINKNDVKWSCTIDPQNCPNKTVQSVQSNKKATAEDTKPASTNTANTNPASTNPASTNPACTNPASTKPASTNPASTKPASTSTASTKPASTSTTSTKPASTSTTSTNIASTKPASTNPASTKPASTKPASTKPASTNTTNMNTTDNSTKNTSNNTTSTSTKNTDNNSNANVSYAQQVVNLVNVERAKEGLAALTVDQNVQNAAMIRANEIQSKFEHVRPNGSSFSTVLKENGVTYRGAGENIAWGQKTPEEVVTAWMNSPGHRANIMNKNFVHIGVGNIQNSAGTQYWVQLFTN